MSAGDRTPGRRIACPFDGDGILRDPTRPGDYWYEPNVGWSGVTPNGHQIRFGAISTGAIQHDDQTISITAIFFSQWKGRIEHGVWLEERP